MTPHLITGHAGEEHVSAEDTGRFNAAVIGPGKYILATGERFAYEIISNNLIKVRSGDMLNQGRHISIPENDYVECYLENGTQFQQRYDLIVMRYSKDLDTTIEKATVEVLKGLPSSAPVDPEYEKGNIISGDLVDDTLLYRVRFDGLNIVGVDCLFDDELLSITELIDLVAETSNELKSIMDNKADDDDILAVNNRIDNLVLGAGDSSAECADARLSDDGTAYATLKKRLDAEHSVLKTKLKEETSKLSDEIDVNHAEINTIKEKCNLFNVSNFNADGYYKVDGTFTSENQGYGSSGFIKCVENKVIRRSHNGFVTFWDNGLNFISGIESGYTFTTPSNCAYVNVVIEKGTQSVFSVTYADFFGRNNDFLDESIKITDENLNKSSLFKTVENIVKHTTNNMYDRQYYNDEYFFNFSNGRPSTLDGYGSTGFIVCEGGESYKRNINGFITFFDENRTFISGLEGGFTFTTPDSCRYINLAIPLTAKDTFYLIKESEEYIDRYETNIESELFGLVYGSLGDSITFGYGVDKSYSEIISEELGLAFTNYGISGNRLASTDNDNDSSPMCVRYANMSDDLEIITVMGGTNDCASQVPIGTNESEDITTFKGALNVLCRGLLEKYPSKRIGFLTPIQRANNNGAIKQIEYVDAMKEICSLYSIPVFDLYRESGICTIHNDNANGLLSDGLHPNDLGQRLLARKIKHFIETL